MMLELLTSCENSMEYEEMLLNVIAALTNLTFYSCQVSNPHRLPFHRSPMICDELFF